MKRKRGGSQQYRDRQWFVGVRHRHQPDAERLDLPGTEPEPASRPPDRTTTAPASSIASPEPTESDRAAATHASATPTSTTTTIARPGKQRRLRTPDDVQPAPEPEDSRRLEHAGDVGTERLDLLRPAAQPVRALSISGSRTRSAPWRATAAPHSRSRVPNIRPTAPSDREPEQPERDQGGQIEQVIAAGQRLASATTPRRARATASAAFGDVQVERRAARAASSNWTAPARVRTAPSGRAQSRTRGPPPGRGRARFASGR